MSRVINIYSMYEYEAVQQEVDVLKECKATSLKRENEQYSYPDAFFKNLARNDIAKELQKMINYRENKLKAYRIKNAENFI